MQASHLADFNMRWTHDYEKFQFRLGSWRHRAIRECIVTHRMSIGRLFKPSASPSRAAPKSLTCQKNTGRTHDGSISCWIRECIVAFAKPSWCHHMTSGLHRTSVVWSSAPSAKFCYTKAIRCRRDAARLYYEGNTTSYMLRNAIV